MGRRKIEMEMVKDAGSRQVTFSKRRNGLFKKANELAILCGAELAIVVFSPGGKPFSFGHPSVDAVAHRFLQREAAPESGGSSNCSSKEGCAKAEKLKKRLVNLTKQLEAEKKKGEMLERALEKKRLAGGLGPGPGPGDVGKLEKTKRRLEKLREEVKVRAREMEAAASLVMLAAKKEKC